MRISDWSSDVCSSDLWGPFLVVVPKSEISAWMFTLEHHFPNLKVVPYWGSASDRTLLRSYMSAEDLYTARAGMHIVVTSYNIMQCDVEYLRQVKTQFSSPLLLSRLGAPEILVVVFFHEQ